MSVEFFIDLGEFPAEYADAMLQLVGVEARKVARRNVRVDTGELRNSIQLDKVSGDAVEVSANTEYALAQEYGRPDLPNYGFTPYMRPAAKEASDKVPELAKKAEQIALNRSKR